MAGEMDECIAAARAEGYAQGWRAGVEESVPPAVRMARRSPRGGERWDESEIMRAIIEHGPKGGG